MNAKDNGTEELEACRGHIDRLDAALVYVLAERFAVTERIGRLKRERGLPPLDASREREQLARLREIAAEAGLSLQITESVFSHITELVRDRHAKIAGQPESSSP
jgi:chorismate mutase